MLKRKGIYYLLIFLGIAALILVSAGCGSKQEKYPTKPINVIVAYAAGGGTDVGARTLLPYVEKILGQQMIVVNKPGGGGWVGWSELAQAKPDGYTIGYINTPNLMTGYLDPNLKNPHNLSSFVPIANHVVDPGAIAVKKDSPFKDIKDIIEAAKKNPGKVSVTSTGVGSDDHLAAIAIERQTGAKFNVIHSKGFADNLTAVLGGHVDVLFGNVGEVYGPFKDGSIRVLAVMTEQRVEEFPDVPTLKELGINVVSHSARGLAAPKGTPKEIIDILAKAFKQGIENPEHVEKMKKLGLYVKYMGPEEYKRFLEEEERKVKELMGW
ncbi:MAG: tripartite tricarboxylate transporter substrate binding protein [Thermanaeromonas sp.]|uniref:tripartite tricarboxylate transporter substrate binding protein n=1 Tax=Thermanaeromonas sp. TaxID=2003697 RepID=UPI00243C3E69|nr:tripartite tricarboxylate transporter substrate binding protein [Thermanaeromonas sp.]MCG0278744.1 tripartite tricarboxylate transporter substrate binding protein [Thermanaeromonas sp.]